MNKTICLNPKGGRGGTPNVQPSLCDRVYLSDGLACAITTALFYQPLYLIEVRSVQDKGK